VGGAGARADGVAQRVEHAVRGAEALHAHERGRLRHPVDGRHPAHEPLGQALPGVVATEAGAEEHLPLHLGVHVLVALGEEVVEGRVDGVGEDERPRHEGHAQDDGDDRRDEAPPVLPQGPEGDAAHGYRPPRTTVRGPAIGPTLGAGRIAGTETGRPPTPPQHCRERSSS